MIDTRIVGYCPMGCGQTLFVGTGGHITCSYIPCSRPTAVDEILDDPETHHIVQFDFDGYSAIHPLRERLDRQLLTCEVGRYVAELGPPAGTLPQRYRIRVSADGEAPTWEPLKFGEGGNGG